MSIKPAQPRDPLTLIVSDDDLGNFISNLITLERRAIATNEPTVVQATKQAISALNNLQCELGNYTRRQTKPNSPTARSVVECGGAPPLSEPTQTKPPTSDL